MQIKINNALWTIKIVDEAVINNIMKTDGSMGLTIYKTQEILLLNEQANIIKTLKHELTHAWLYEYGHMDRESYSQEDVCEIVSSCNEFINDVVNRYKEVNNENSRFN